jgi:hypothetical protein
MSEAQFDLKGLCNLAVESMVTHAEKQTELPLGELVRPLANNLLSNLGVGMIDVDPLMMAVGKIAYAGWNRQQKIDEAKRMTPNGSG